MLFLHFLRVLFSVRIKRRIIWLMPAAAHTINILLVQILRGGGFTASDLCFNIGEYLGWAHFYEIWPAPQFGPHTTTILWSGGRGHWPPDSATTLRLLPQFTPASSHTNTIIYFSTLPNIFRHFQIFFLINICDKCIANYWAAAGHHRDSEDYCRSDWIRLNIVVTVIWAIEPSSNKRWN